MPKDKSAERETAGKESEAQHIPEEVLRQLPPEVKAQLGIVEEQKPIFRSAYGANAGLNDSIDRLREGFEKIGLTLIGRMGEFASTLERVVTTVARIEKVENLTAEITYFLKNLQKTLEEVKRDFSKMNSSVENLELEMENLKRSVATRPAAPIQPAPAATIPSPPIPSITSTAQTSMKPSITAPITRPPPKPPLKPILEPSPSPLQAPAPASPPAPAIPTPDSTGSPTDALFREIHIQISKVDLHPKILADLLDRARERITQTCKWTPAIHEIGKLARKIRQSKKVLSHKDRSDINETLEELKKQIVLK